MKLNPPRITRMHTNTNSQISVYWRLFAGALLFLISDLGPLTSAFAQAPTTTNKGVTIDANGNILPTTINGHPPNLPAGTTLAGAPISGVSDGDKGDITVSGSGTIWSVDSGAIPFSELSGSAAIGQIPTGTSGTTVALGNHNHAYSTLTGLPTLGTASALNTGTTSGTIPVLGVGDKLPAVDGSLLTNLPGLPSLPVGKTLFVDSVNGSDGTGTTGRLDKPFLTPTAAKTAATSGDLIWVGPGMYNQNDLLKDGVNWHFESEATVRYTQIALSNDDYIPGIFDDGGNDISCTISGEGVFDFASDNTSYNGGTTATVRLTGGGRVTISAKSIIVSGGSLEGQKAAAVSVNNASAVVNVSAETIDGGVVEGHWLAAGISARSGELSVKALKIFGAEAVSLYGGNGASQVRVEAGLIHGQIAGVTQYRDTANDKLWVRAIEILSETTAVANGGGKLYVEAQKISSNGTAIEDVTNIGAIWWASITAPANTWITAQKVTLPSGAYNGFTNAGFGSTTASQAWVTISHLETLGACSAIVSSTNAYDTSVIEVGDSLGSASSNGIVISAGSLRLKNSTINTVANSATNPITKSGGTLVLDNVTLSAEATRDSITAGTPQSVTSYASTANKAVNANVTVNGQLSINGVIQGDDTAYDATSWNGNTGVATKNAVRDKFESLSAGGSVATDTIWDALGDLAYGTGADTASKLAGNTTATKKFLRQTGNGSVSAAPAWDTLVSGDIPTLNQDTTGSAASLSISGQTGLLTFTGLASTNRAKTVRDAADTILELGGSYTPSGTWTNLTLVNPALGTPASGVVTNLTGTASININGTVGATTPAAGAFTTGSFSSTITGSTLSSAVGTTLNLNGTIPAAAASTTAGTAANFTASAAIAGTTNAGAAAGGSVTITAGNAARLTSGNANGGNITLATGTGIGTGTQGQVLIPSTSDAVTPMLSSSSSTQTGISMSSNFIFFIRSGVRYAEFGNNGALGFQVGSGSSYGFSSNADPFNATIDANLSRNAAGQIQANTGTAGNWASYFGGTTDTGTTTAPDAATFSHKLSSGTAAAGLGISVLFNGHTTTTADQNMARISAIFTDATHATRTADVVISTVNNAAALAEKFRVVSTGGISWNSGAVLKKVLSATATLDFASTAAGASSDLTITVTGAASGDVVSIGVPNGSTVANSSFSAWVSAADTVTVRFVDNALVGAADPPSGTFRAQVNQF